MRDPTERFSDRVESYLRYRPGYPRAIVELLRRECGLSPHWVVADIGSGTGLLSQLFLDAGCRVLGVEPNRAMRQAGERALGGFDRFISVAGTAESTGLKSACVDLVTAGQAFHWFEPRAARLEFERILRPSGWVALIWNDRRRQASSFLRAYERLLLRYGTDYRHVDHTRIGGPELERFFQPASYRQASFETVQDCDLQGLRGRLLSSSYVPTGGQRGHGAMLDELHRIFSAHQVDGQVRFEYDTRVYYASLI